LHHRVDKLEMGLSIMKAERFTSETERPDFIAVDRNGKIVLIECKASQNCDKTGIETSQVDTLLKALKQKLKQELTADPPSTALKTVEVTV